MIEWNPWSIKKFPRFTGEFTEYENDHIMNCRQCQHEIHKILYDAKKAGVKYVTDDN